MPVDGLFVVGAPNDAVLKRPSTLTFERKGVVHVGAFTVSLEVNANGDLIITAFPEGLGETVPLTGFAVGKAVAIESGGVDLDLGG